MKVWQLAVLVAGGFAWGWVSNGWRLGLEAERVARAHAERVAAVEKAAREAEQAAQARATEAVAAARKKLEKSQHETARLRSCLADGSCGLRVAAPSCSGPVPEAPEGGPLDSGADAPAPASAAPHYLALRDAIELTEAKLAGCQEALRPLVTPP